MKKILIPSLLFLTFAVPLVSSAADKTVTVEWTMPTESLADVQNYVLNYSQNSDMSGATPQPCDPWQQTGTTGEQTSFAMVCNDVPVVPGQLAYFTLQTETTDNQKYESAVFAKDYKLTQVMNFEVLTPGGNVPPTALLVTNTTSGFAPLTVTFDGRESNDVDGTITYLWNFGDGQSSTENLVSHTYNTVGEFNVSLIVTDDKNVASEPARTTITTIAPPPGPDYAINFQPSDVPVPTGYQMDSGSGFDTGVGYGWTSGPASIGTRDRDNSVSPDQAYDTMIHVAPTGVWEIEVPNGNYSVTICVGDASYPDGTNNIQVEGSIIVDNVILSNTVPWTEKTGTVSVGDGRVTITFTGSDPLARLCWLTITKF